MEKLKIGDKVLIRLESKYYHQAPGKIGEVMSTMYDEHSWVQVIFGTYQNAYQLKDLMKAEMIEPLINFNSELIEMLKNM